MAKVSEHYFMTSERIGFRCWREDDYSLAQQLWGDKDVAQFITSKIRFSTDEIAARLDNEIALMLAHNIQYWPIFDLSSGGFIGCCGLRPYANAPGTAELGFHLIKEYWGKGIALEAALRVKDYAFKELAFESLFAGHHPDNTASKKLLGKLGFEYEEDSFYPPSGLDHPGYFLKNISTK